MSSFIPNQPVFFPGSAADCGCAPKNFCQPIIPSDVTNFLLPNKCRGTVGSNVLLDSDFSTYSDHCEVFSNVTACSNDWVEDTSNGGTGHWTIGSGYINGNGVPSSILKHAVSILPYHKYRFTLNIATDTGVNCDIVVVGFNADGTYEVITTFSAPGGYIDFSSTKGFVSIGFYQEGTCANPSILDRITSAELAEITYADCVSISVIDGDDNNVGSGTVKGYYDNFIWGQVDWSEINPEPGKCYRICIDGDVFFGNNLFTYGDYGTFENNIDNITLYSPPDPSRVSDDSHTGQYCARTLAAANAILMKITPGADGIRLKPNTDYTVSVWVRVQKNNNFTRTINLKILDGAGSIVGTASIVNSTTDTGWQKLEINYTSGETGDSCIIFPQIISGVEAAWSACTVDIDDMVIVETDTYNVCSAPFCLPTKETCNHSLLTYSNNEDAFGFIYPSGFVFNMRLPGTLSRPKYTNEITSYDYDNGQRVITYANSRKISQFIVGDCPEYVHDALRLAVLHDNFSVDAVPYVVEPKEYDPQWRDKTNLASVVIEISLATQDTRNNFL